MRRPWTPAETELLRAAYPDAITTALAQALNRTAEQVYNKANSLGLRKSEAWQQSDNSGRRQRGQTDPRMTPTQFQPGQQPWNKGIKFDSGGRSHETRFKPGRPPSQASNYKPIGSLRICRDGYLERKVTDDTAIAPPRRWIAEHRLVWEQAHGPIPPGHIIRFKPGQKTTEAQHITPDKLECISRAEHATRNHPRSKNPELGRLIQLKGQITRQVNRINRQEQQP